MKFVYKNCYPITFIEKEILLLYKNGTFLCLNLKTEILTKVYNFPLSFIEKLINHIPLLTRVLRKGIRCSIKLSDEILIFLYQQTIYELNLKTGKMSNGYTTKDNSRPLVFSKIEGISGFDDGIYFGGYKGNPSKKPISIYKRVDTDIWIDIFQFPEGKIEHIHNIIADKYNDTVFILTGDFDNSAGIWISKNGFKDIIPLYIGDQSYRSCIAFPTTEGLLFATDSPFTQNKIQLLTKSKSEIWKINTITEINGPCIYGCMWKEHFVFSTSVEGDGLSNTFNYKLFGRKLGVGIKNRYSYVYKGNISDGFKIIYKVKKDILPFYLFQFGVLTFPSGENTSVFLPIYHIATKKYDLSTLIYSESH